MSWFAELAGKAESLLNNFDEQTGVALRNHTVTKPKKIDRHEPHLEPWTAAQRKRPALRNYKKLTAQKSPTSISPNRKPSQYNTPPIKDSRESRNPSPPKVRKKKPANDPKTLVSEFKDSSTIVTEHLYQNKERRLSMPSSLDIPKSNKIGDSENLELENMMLKNELTFVNREMADLVNQLRITEEELNKTKEEFEFYEQHKSELNTEKQSLMNKIDELKKELYNFKLNEQKRFTEKTQQWRQEVSNLTERNKDLENTVNNLQEKYFEKESNQLKLETELRHAQIKAKELRTELDKSNNECKRLEKDWDTYKNRVKSMLLAKDKEIKALNESYNEGFNEDNKILLNQIENLKKERSELSERLTTLRTDNEDMKQYITSLETRHNAAERVVGALRDALKDERFARNRAEAQHAAANKELKSIQIETGQTIANLRTALREKENELDQLRESLSSTPRTDPSALNVADYDSNKDSETIKCLTQKLVQRQSKIDSLLADNNTLKIQLAKIQAEYKSELSKKNSESVVDLNEERSRSRHPKKDSSSVSKLSVRMGLLIRRNPIFRFIILIYIMGLHVWVVTVLLASTPENINLTLPNRK